MKAVNPATQYVMERLGKTTAEIKKMGKGTHPFDIVQMAHEHMGHGTVWDDEHKKMAIEGIKSAVVDLVTDSLTTVIKEVAELGSFASDSNSERGKKAADNMLKSMDFLTVVLKTFGLFVDFDHVAEHLFDEGYEILQARLAAGTYVPGAGVVGQLSKEATDKAQAINDALNVVRDLIGAAKQDKPAPSPAKTKPRWSTGFSPN